MQEPNNSLKLLYLRCAVGEISCYINPEAEHHVDIYLNSRYIKTVPAIEAASVMYELRESTHEVV